MVMWPAVVAVERPSQACQEVICKRLQTSPGTVMSLPGFHQFNKPLWNLGCLHVSCLDASRCPVQGFQALAYHTISLSSRIRPSAVAHSRDESALEKHLFCFCLESWDDIHSIKSTRPVNLRASRGRRSWHPVEDTPSVEGLKQVPLQILISDVTV